MPSTCNKRPAELFGLRSKTEYGPQGNTMKKRKLWFRSPRPQLWPRNWRRTRKNPPDARATLASSYDAIFREAQQEHLILLTGVVAPLAAPTVTGVLVAVHTIVPVVASTIVPAIAPTVVPVVAPAIVPSSRKRSSAMTAEISTSHVKDGRFHPYLKTQSSLRSSSHTAPPVVTRSRSGASGSFNKETRDLAWYLRQSKTSTSQKRPTVSKSSFKVAGVMDATTAKDGTVHTSPQDTEQSRSSEGASKDQSAEKEVSQGRIPTRGEDARGDNTGDALSNESNRDDGDQGAGDDDDDEDDQGGEVDEEGGEDEDDEDEYDHHQQSNDQDGLFPSGGSMSGMVSGMSSRLQGILTNLRAYEDPFLQLIALQDLALLLSVSTEDSLAEYFDCDAFVKELVLLAHGTGDGFGDLRNMTSACRCLCKLMETMPASIEYVVHGNAVPVLCAKLIDIQYVDLAGEALMALEKISSQYPHIVVSEGGFAAALMDLELFSTNVQRTAAVKVAANCCRGMHQDCIPMVKKFLPILEDLLQYSDYVIVEQACLCFVHLADSFKNNAAHLQSVLTEAVLRSILTLFSPNANVIVGPHVNALLLEFLGTVAEFSQQLGFALLTMGFIDTLSFTLDINTDPECDKKIKAIAGTLNKLVSDLSQEDPHSGAKSKQ